MFRKTKKSLKYKNSNNRSTSRQCNVDLEDTHIKYDKKLRTKKGKCDPCLPCELALSALCLGCAYGVYSCAEDQCYNDCVCDPMSDCSCGRRNFGCF